MDFGFWAVVFVSERTIKIAYISAAQRPPRGRRCDSLYCGRFFDGLAQGLGAGLYMAAGVARQPWLRP